MNKRIDFKSSSFWIFLIIAVLYCIGNFIWWYLNTPIFPDGVPVDHFNDIFREEYLYFNAPLITWITKGIFFVFGKKYFDLEIIFMNYIFFLIALYFIYKVGVELKDKETGNIAMILLALTPVVYGLSRQYGHQEYHIMVAMIVNIYCLIMLNDFKDRKWSILYGISVGLGLLVKDEFLPYFFIPWLYVVIRSLIEKIDIKKIINILLTIIIGSLIAGCHYFRFEIIYKILHEPVKEIAPVFCFESLKITTTGLSEFLLSPPIFILFIVGLIWFVLKYRNKNKMIMLLWIIVPWTIITFMQHYKLPEYCLGFIPGIILICSLFITNIKNIKKNLLLISIIFICLLQYFDFSYGINTRLFNFNIKYKDYEFSYYDKKNFFEKLIVNKSYFKIAQHLSLFDEKNILLWDACKENPASIQSMAIFFFYKGINYYPNISYIEEIIQMCCGTIRFKQEDTTDLFIDKFLWYFDDMIILEIGKKTSALDIADFYFNITQYDYKNEQEKELFKKEFVKRLEILKEYFEKNFYLADSFYLDNIEDEDHLVEIYRNNKNKI